MAEVSEHSAAEIQTPAPPPARLRALAAEPGAAAAVAALALGACGGGSDPVAGPPPAPVAITDARASRFLAQASMGATRGEIDKLKSLGYAAWLDAQFAQATDTTRWDWLVAKGYADIANKNNQTGFDSVAWRKLIAAPDTLRQRVTLALSEIIVVSIDGLSTSWRQFSSAAWLDLLEKHAFGNLRTLLGEVSTSLQMGLYLTFKGNAKANAAKGSLPDENYARELMQLFTIGLSELNPDGSEKKLTSGKPQDTYGPPDIGGLARVFTGWDVDLVGGNTDTPDYHKRPMIQIASRYETAEKVFLGLTIPSGTDAPTAMKMALDHLFAHPNIAPFWSRQLIQRLVTSNPSPAYVQRVAAVFANDGSGQRGNLKAVLRALLLDDEARSDAALNSANAGKLREPILRFTGWARAFSANSPSDAWAIGNTTDPATRLGQSPLRSPSVFNFFRPGYVPPNSGIGTAALVAPEFQITNESSVVGYVNFMQTVVSAGRGDTKADYSALLPLADDAAALVAEIDVLLAAGQLADTTRKTIADAVGTITIGTDAKRLSRINAALVLVLAAPEFLVLK